MQNLVNEAMACQQELQAWRRQLHQMPELGMETHETTAFLKQKLEEMGYTPQPCAGTGLVCTVGKPGKTVLLRADIDALPIREEAEVDYASDNGCMHACGHDMHAAMLLGAAKLLKAHEAELQGTVKLMFQPAEETLSGAKAMIEDGLLENPPVDAAYMFHVFPGMPAPAGILIVPGGGEFSASSDSFEIHIQGKGGHGAMPNMAVDPLVVATSIHQAMQNIRSRELAGADNVVISVCAINGGSAYNVIPDTAVMKGTIRTFDDEVREFIPQRIKALAEGIAEGFRAKAEFKLIPGCPTVTIDGAVAGAARDILTETFGAESVPPAEMLGFTKMNGSEDFSYVSKKVPSCMLSISAGNSNDGYTYSVHHPKARFDDGILFRGAAAYAALGAGWLAKNV